MTYDARDFTINANRVYALEGALNALKSKNLTIVNYNQLTNVIEAETGLTWTSFGISLSVQILGSIDEDYCQLSITATDEQVMNWGAGQALCQDIYRETAAFAEAKQRQARRDSERAAADAKREAEDRVKRLYASPKFCRCSSCGGDVELLAKTCPTCSTSQIQLTSELPAS